MKKIFTFLLLVSILFLPVIAKADTLGQGLLNESVKGIGLEGDLETSLANIISTVLTMVGTVFLVLTIAGGIMWMTAAGNDEKIKKAQKIIIGATVGLIISLTAYTITYFVTKGAGGAISGGGSSEPGCCHTSTDSLGNDWNIMSESQCQEQTGYMDWVPDTAGC